MRKQCIHRQSWCFSMIWTTFFLHGTKFIKKKIKAVKKLFGALTNQTFRIHAVIIFLRWQPKTTSMYILSRCLNQLPLLYVQGLFSRLIRSFNDQHYSCRNHNIPLLAEYVYTYYVFLILQLISNLAGLRLLKRVIQYPILRIQACT